jgi:phosphonatase-like hydrolase
MSGGVQLVVLDMAGTTVRDTGQVSRALVAALAKHGIDVTPEELNRMRGASKRQALLNLIPAGPDRERLSDSAYRSFRDLLMESCRLEGVEPVPGAEDVFRSLRARGVRVALNTGFDRDIAWLLLAALRWEEGVVDAVVCGDEVRSGRPAPYLIFHAMEATGATDVRRVASVGDTVLDLAAGRNAGVGWNVGVLSGAHPRSRLEEAPHTHLIESVADLWSAIGEPS